MADTVPASKVAAAALTRVRLALASLTTEYDAPDLAHLEAAADLLALIVKPTTEVVPRGNVNPSATTTPPPPKPKG